MKTKKFQRDELKGKWRHKSSKGKVILRTAGPETTRKLLPIKPKQQIFIIQNEKPQALNADAELNFLIPARNQPAYTISLDNSSIGTEFTDEIEETWNTNENVTAVQWVSQ